MKYTVKRNIIFECLLDSSQAIMLNQGGKHFIKLDAKLIEKIIAEVPIENEDDEDDDFKVQTDVYFTVQIDDRFKFRTDWIQKEAQNHNHKESVKDEN